MEETVSNIPYLSASPLAFRFEIYGCLLLSFPPIILHIKKIIFDFLVKLIYTCIGGTLKDISKGT